MNKEQMTSREAGEYIRQVKENSICSDCKRKYPYYVLSFTHRDSNSKKFNIASARDHGVYKEELLEEISKCDIICSNCTAVRQYRKHLRNKPYTGIPKVPLEHIKKMIDEYNRDI